MYEKHINCTYRNLVSEAKKTHAVTCSNCDFEVPGTEVTVALLRCKPTEASCAAPGRALHTQQSKAHHDGTQAVLRVLAPLHLLGAVRREIQVAEWVPDVSGEFPFLLALPFKPETKFGTFLNNTQLFFFLTFFFCCGCLTDFPRGEENQ